jgi:hypothetical protein
MDVDSDGRAPPDPVAVIRGRPRRMACGHPSHRTIQLWVPYAEANSIRVQFAAAVSSTPKSVSPLRRSAGAWSFTTCQRCLAGTEDADST